MDSLDVVVSSRREQRFNFSMEQVEPINTPGLQEAPSPARLQVQFVFVTKHQIFVCPSSTGSIDSLPSPLQETRPNLIHRYEDARTKLCGELFDLNVLLSTVDILGPKLAPFLLQFKIKQGSEDHAGIVSEVKREGRRICQERKNRGLFSLRVSITRVLTTYHHCKKHTTEEKVLKGEEIMVPVIGVKRRSVRVQGEEMCSLCLEEFRVRSCISMPCSHVFHTKCVETWLQGRHKRSCPLCRFEVPALVGPRLITDMYHLGHVLAY